MPAAALSAEQQTFLTAFRNEPANQLLIEQYQLAVRAMNRFTESLPEQYKPALAFSPPEAGGDGRPRPAGTTIDLRSAPARLQRQYDELEENLTRNGGLLLRRVEAAYEASHGRERNPPFTDSIVSYLKNTAADVPAAPRTRSDARDAGASATIQQALASAGNPAYQPGGTNREGNLNDGLPLLPSTGRGPDRRA